MVFPCMFQFETCFLFTRWHDYNWSLINNGVGVKITSHLSFCFVIFVATTSASLSQAQLGDDISGSSDHPAIERFPDSQIVAYESSRDQNYQLVLGNLRRVARQVVPEQVERLRGDVTRITYQVSQSFTGADVFEFYQDQVQQQGFNLLFSCVGLDCGSSSYWANTAFGNRILNGPERNQYFMALESGASATDKTYLSVYVITRANRRLYAHVEVVEVGDHARLESPAMDLQTLESQSSLVIQDLQFNQQDQLTSDSGIAELVQLMQDNPELRLYVVGHIDESGNLAAIIARSLDRANQVRDRLLEQGIDSERVSAQGVGPLSPSCLGDNCGSRIEVVIQ